MKLSARFFLVVLTAAIFLAMTGCAGTDYRKGLKDYKPENAAAAVRELKPLAERGDADAQYKLGSLYYQGWGVSQDYREAIKLFRKAADQRHLNAQINLGAMYSEGLQDVVEKDYPQALMWFIFAAAQGDMETMQRRDDLALKMTPAQIAEAQRLAREFKTADVYTRQFNEQKNLAGQGDGSAQFNLALMYYHGRGTASNYREAMEWFKRAAQQGHPLAQYNVGYMYEKGEGAPQDYVEAAKWYRQAAERGNAQAQFVLGGLFEKGMGVMQDEVKALMWFNLSAAQGETKARTARDRITVWMTPAQITEAQRLAREFKAVGK